MNDYKEFLRQKQEVAPSYGFECGDLSPALFPFQSDITKWALRRGRAAIFEDCGLGKSFQELEWGNQVCGNTGRPVILLAPLAVSIQFKRESEKFNIPVTLCRTQSDVRDGINVTNYEMLEHFNPSIFSGVIIDESSILKNFASKTKQTILDMFSNTPYRLAATATPAPNDHMELGNHAEFLGIMSRTEMLSEFFTHDGGDTSQWRLKGHAEDVFWQWVSQWAVAISKPSDLGYSDEGYDLPPIQYHHHVVDCDSYDGSLFPEAAGINEQRRSKRNSMTARVDRVAEIVADCSDQPWVIWGELNDECNQLKDAIPGAINIQGSDTNDAKVSKMTDFLNGDVRVLVSKPSVCGFGMNMQHCHNVAFVGLSNSYEQTYQAIRRCHRYGQANPVDVHFTYAPAEEPIMRNLKRKEADAERMRSQMVACLSGDWKTHRQTNDYNPNQKMFVPQWLHDNRERN